MSTLSDACVGVHPRIRPAVEALGGWLREQDYATQRIREILDYVIREGTTGGLVEAGILDREHDELVAEIYCEALPEIPWGDEQWLAPDIYLDTRSITVAAFHRAARAATARLYGRMAGVISGGSPAATADWVDPTADANGDPVYYEAGRPSPHPVIGREPFDPGCDGDGPTDEEWEEMCRASLLARPEFTPSGWLD